MNITEKSFSNSVKYQLATFKLRLSEQTVIDSRVAVCNHYIESLEFALTFFRSNCTQYATFKRIIQSAVSDIQLQRNYIVAGVGRSLAQPAEVVGQGSTEPRLCQNCYGSGLDCTEHNSGQCHVCHGTGFDSSPLNLSGVSHG